MEDDGDAGEADHWRPIFPITAGITPIPSTPVFMPYANRFHVLSLFLFDVICCYLFVVIGFFVIICLFVIILGLFPLPLHPHPQLITFCIMFLFLLFFDAGFPLKPP